MQENDHETSARLLRYCVCLCAVWFYRKTAYSRWSQIDNVYVSIQHWHTHLNFCLKAISKQIIFYIYVRFRLCKQIRYTLTSKKIVDWRRIMDKRQGIESFSFIFAIDRCCVVFLNSSGKVYLLSIPDQHKRKRTHTHIYSTGSQ